MQKRAKNKYEKPFTNFLPAISVRKETYAQSDTMTDNTKTV